VVVAGPELGLIGAGVVGAGSATGGLVGVATGGLVGAATGGFVGVATGGLVGPSRMITSAQFTNCSPNKPGVSPAEAIGINSGPESVHGLILAVQNEPSSGLPKELLPPK